MKYALRLVWYIAKIAAIAAAVFAVLVVAFFIAMDSANVFVIVTDGMKARATSILTPGDNTSLTKYFSAAYLKQQVTDVEDLSEYTITDFNYKITVESLWCKPWDNTATVTVVESIPEFNYTVNDDISVKDKEGLPGPQWQKARYQITCRRADGVWRIYSVSTLEKLMPDPTMTPEPTLYITATPVPSPSPTPTPLASSSVLPAISPSPTTK